MQYNCDNYIAAALDRIFQGGGGRLRAVRTPQRSSAPWPSPTVPRPRFWGAEPSFFAPRIRVTFKPSSFLQLSSQPTRRHALARWPNPIPSAPAHSLPPTREPSGRKEAKLNRQLGRERKKEAGMGLLGVYSSRPRLQVTPCLFSRQGGKKEEKREKKTNPETKTAHWRTVRPDVPLDHGGQDPFVGGSMGNPPTAKNAQHPRGVQFLLDRSKKTAQKQKPAPTANKDAAAAERKRAPAHSPFRLTKIYVLAAGHSDSQK